LGIGFTKFPSSTQKKNSARASLRNIDIPLTEYSESGCVVIKPKIKKTHVRKTGMVFLKLAEMVGALTTTLTQETDIKSFYN
jgi:hypothetical protein